MYQKKRRYLEIGIPVYMKNSTHVKGNPLHSLELLDFSLVNGRVEWNIRVGAGQIISGRTQDQQKIPFIEGAWIALALPIILHKKPNSFAPDFMINAPEIITLSIQKP